MRILKKLTSLSWTSVISGASAFAVRFFLIALLAFLILVIIRGLNVDGYKIQAVQVPKKFHDAGYTGQVIAFMVADKVTELKRVARTVRVDSLNLNVDMGKDLTMDVMGVGLSAESIIHHVRELLGRKNYTIGGEITDMDGQINYNLRMTGYEAEHITVPYKEGSSRKALNESIELAALTVLKNTDPYRLALIYYRRDEIEKSKEVLRFMITNNPLERKWAYHMWGNIASKQEKMEIAKLYYTKAMDEDPEFVLPMVSLAWEAFQNKEYKEGAELFEKIIKIEPKHQNARNGASLCYRNLGDLNKAEEHLKQQLENYPENIFNYGNYSHFLLLFRKDTTQAVHLYERASENIPVSGDLYIALASFNQMIGDSVKALQNIYQTLELEPENVLALNAMARYEERTNKDYSKAKVYYKRYVVAMEKGQYDKSMKSSGYNNLAIVEYQQGELDSALIHANKAILTFPTNPFPWSTLAEVYLLKGNQKEFYKNIQKAIVLGLDVTQFLDEYPYTLIKDKSKVYQIIEEQKETLALKG